MGILNVTPDSFSDGGKYASIDAALKKAREMVDSGAAIIDIGAESTRPGAEIVSESEELTRLIPAVEAVHAKFPMLCCRPTPISRQSPRRRWKRERI